MEENAGSPLEEAVAYYRVSTPRQGRSGLGLDAQKEAVDAYKWWHKLAIVKELYEVESGKRSKRPQLKKALRYCKKHGCTLIIANISRLARDALFVASLLEKTVRIVAANKPLADHLDLLEDAIHAQREGREISKRTKDALQAAKRRGVELGKNGKVLAQINKRQAQEFAQKMAPVIQSLREEGITTCQGMAQELNRRRVRPFRKTSRWHPSSIHTLLKRIKN